MAAPARRPVHAAAGCSEQRIDGDIDPLGERANELLVRELLHR